MAFKTTVLLLADKRVILINSGYPYVCVCARARVCKFNLWGRRDIGSK